MQDNQILSVSDAERRWESLLQQSAWIAGPWGSSGYSTIDVFNPATRERIGAVPALGRDSVYHAVTTATDALPPWRSRVSCDRGDVLRRWNRLVLENREGLAQLITVEQGKPIREARAEIDYAASFIAWFADEGSRLYGESIPSHLPGRKLAIHHEPIGVVAAITPWNFPSAMLARKAAAALAAGCTVVAIPSLETPFSALALAVLAEQAGLPPGALSVLTGDPTIIVPELCATSSVRAVSFTGSTEIGKKLLAQCAATVKRTCMELGGHAPFIVFPDVDVAAVVSDAVVAKFQTSGQDCLAANRIFVHREIYEQFVSLFSSAVNALKVGSGFDERVEIGPLISSHAVEKCEAHVDDAITRGARITTGGHVLGLGPTYFAPTVLADVTSEMRICHEETFGPVAAVLPFDEELEAIMAANNTEYGLIAYVYTSDNRRALRVTDALEYGMVAINSVKITGAPIPFGGVKQSGIGREGGRYGIHEFTELKYVCMAI